VVTAYLVLLLLLAVERLVELRVSRRNRAWALSRGGIELGQSHFPWMVLLHGSFLFACAAEVVLLERPFYGWLGVPMLLVLAAAQALRYWAILTLGRRWNVRVIAIPGAPLVDTGPYRTIRHPNYLAVVLELVSVPLIHSAWLTALVYSGLNALLLMVRIRCEEGALSLHSQYEERMGDRGRFFPCRLVSLQRDVPQQQAISADPKQSTGPR